MVKVGKRLSPVGMMMGQTGTQSQGSTCTWGPEGRRGSRKETGDAGDRKLGREVSPVSSVHCSCRRREKPPGALRLCNSEEKRAVHRELVVHGTLVVEG